MGGVPVGVDDLLERRRVLVGLEVRRGGLTRRNGVEDGAHLGVAGEGRPFAKHLGPGTRRPGRGQGIIVKYEGLWRPQEYL